MQRLLGTQLGSLCQGYRKYLCRNLWITHPKLGAAEGQDDICIWQSEGLPSTFIPAPVCWSTMCNKWKMQGELYFRIPSPEFWRMAGAQHFSCYGLEIDLSFCCYYYHFVAISSYTCLPPHRCQQVAVAWVLMKSQTFSQYFSCVNLFIFRGLEMDVNENERMSHVGIRRRDCHREGSQCKGPVVRWV